MPTIVLNKIAQPQALSEFAKNDQSTPLSFKDWIKNNIGIIPEDSQKQYEKYFTEFYTKKNSTKSSSANKLREDYISLVKRLSVIFKNDEEFQRFAQIDFDSPVELKLAIPYFAKKLKEVALFFVQQRENLKKTKLQYAAIGSETGLERYLYSKLLNIFSSNIPLDSKDTTYITPDELTEIRKDFSITVEELFEDENYFETGNILDESPLFCVLDNEISNLCTSSDEENIYTSDPLSREYLCESDYINTTELVVDGWGKYSSTDLFYVSGGERIPNMIDVELSFDEDNNYFYWFKGETVNEIPQGLFSDTSLTALNWEDATAGETIDTSDIIFASFGNLKTEAAWFMSADKVSFVTEMTATMLDEKEFKFPYPGIGLSAEGSEWTGRQLTDILEEDKRFFPNESSYQENIKNIEALYWSDATSISSIDDISIQNLTLWNDGAYASNNFNNADKIIVRTNTGNDKIHDFNPDEVYQGDLEIAWLYNFTQTQIPIIVEQSNIYFPLTSFSNADDLSLKYSVGTSIPLSAVRVNGAFAGAVAGDDIVNSDFIVKKKTICGPDLEAAWLEGTPLSAFRDDDPDFCVCDDVNKFVSSTNWTFSKGVSQPALSFKAGSNEIVKFVWTGPTTPIAEIRGFNGFVHDDSCPYSQIKTNKSLLDINFKNFDRDAAEKWRQCTCRSVYHSPIGQKNADINAFKIIPDLILEDTDPNVSNLSEWRGTDGKPYTTSIDASWFLLTESPDIDVGWGKGQWQNNFELKRGRTYWYYRTNLNRCDITLPFFVINECYVETITKCDQRSNIPVWKKAVKNAANEWVKTDEITDLVLSFGDLYDYTHRQNAGWETTRLRIDDEYVEPEDFITVNKLIDNYSFDIKTYMLPSVEFLIKIPLIDNAPYWGHASYENNVDTKGKKILRNYDDNRVVGTYLISNQAIPSEIILSDNTTIRYELSECNDCFIWKQPVVMNVLAPERRWNKLLMSECVQSEILDYLHRSCGADCEIVNLCDCGSICSSVKSGVTATNEPANIVFNTDLSGVPLFVNYYARFPFDLNFQVEDLINPAYAPILSGTLLEVESPWQNLINDLQSSFVSTQNSSSLRSRADVGVFVPEKIAIGKYELHDAESFYTIDSSEITFRQDNYFDGPYSPINIDSSWMKNPVGLPLIQSKQTYYPYESDNTLGLYTERYPISPWDISDTNVCSVNDLYTNYVENVTGDIIRWKTDIYGNQFFLTSGDGQLWLRIGENIVSGGDALSSIFLKYTGEEIIELNNITNLNMFYDTLELVHTSSDSVQFVTYNKLNWDYDSGTYNSYSDNIYLDIGPLSSDSRFIASFLDDEIKKSHIFILSDQDTYTKVKYYEYDINMHNLQEHNITTESDWETANLGTINTAQVPHASYFNDVVDVVFGTTNVLNIFTLDISTNSVELINVQKFTVDDGVILTSIQRQSDGLFLFLNDNGYLSAIKLS